MLWRFGGVYVDTDFECHRPLDALIDGLEFFTAPLKPNDRLRQQRVHRLDPPPPDPRPRPPRAASARVPRLDKAATGPRFLDTLLRDYPEVTLLPAELFYQTSPGQLEGAYATHHAAGSWRGIEDYQEALRIADQRTFELRGQVEQLRRELESAQVRLARSRGAAPGRRRGLPRPRAAGGSAPGRACRAGRGRRQARARS